MKVRRATKLRRIRNSLVNFIFPVERFATWVNEKRLGYLMIYFTNRESYTKFHYIMKRICDRILDMTDSLTQDLSQGDLRDQIEYYYSSHQDLKDALKSLLKELEVEDDV